MRGVRTVLLAITVLAASLAVATPSAAARTYRGVMTNGGGPVRSGEQGALWQSRFVEHKRGTVLYSACVIFRGKRGVVQCKPGRSNRGGTDRISYRRDARAAPCSHIPRAGGRAFVRRGVVSPRAQRQRIRSPRGPAAPLWQLSTRWGDRARGRAPEERGCRLLRRDLRAPVGPERAVQGSGRKRSTALLPAELIKRGLRPWLLTPAPLDATRHRRRPSQRAL